MYRNPGKPALLKLAITANGDIEQPRCAGDGETESLSILTHHLEEGGGPRGELRALRLLLPRSDLREAALTPETGTLPKRKGLLMT
jgi:hypothetical protein